MPKFVAALDIGSARIGIASADLSTRIATPHSTLHIKNSSNPAAEIAALLNDLNIKTVIVGWPLQLDGSEGPAIKRTKKFLVQLRTAAPNIKIIPQDERMTSVVAENALQEMHTVGSEKKNFVDSMAASLILQTWLDANK